jgi:hypothetical protein
MALTGERLIIAATLDEVETGETFATIPPHMTVVRWFNLQENRQFRLTGAMDRVLGDKPATVFDEAPDKHVVGGNLALFGRWYEPTLVRRLNNVSNGPYFALHALVKSIGDFDPKDRFSDTFHPHITHTKERSVKRGEAISFASVALIGTQGKHEEHHVIESFPLGRDDA